MKTQHTPGPWQVNIAGFVGPSDVNGTERWKTGNDIIAEVIPTPYPDGYSRPKAENMANARLIAAAPDLLAACRRLLTGQKENSEAIISQACAMAAAAIADAEGKRQ